MRTERFHGGVARFDEEAWPKLEVEHFDPAWWQLRGSISQPEGGRGSTWLIDIDAASLVLRHYRRGGLMTHLSVDRYLWTGEPRVRSLAEFDRLAQMRELAVSVPQPLAAAYWRSGASYRAALLMRRIDAADSLAGGLRTRVLPLEIWVRIGHCLQRAHAAGLWHADLNAHNILVDANGQVWLIDLDRARVRAPGLWTDANLARLYRSLDKLAVQWEPGRFTDADWAALLKGYLAARSEYQRDAQDSQEARRLATLLE